jgi:hypothetical protein
VGFTVVLKYDSLYVFYAQLRHVMQRARYAVLTRVGPKFFGQTYKSRAKWKMLREIYSAIYSEVNVSVSVCVEIKGDYIEK